MMRLINVMIMSTRKRHFNACILSWSKFRDENMQTVLADMPLNFLSAMFTHQGLEDHEYIILTCVYV